MTAVPPPLPQRDWAQRNRAWFLPLLVVLGLALTVGFVYGIFSLVVGQMKSHPAYIEALARTRGNAQAVAALGLPIEEPWMVMGSVAGGAKRGSAHLQIPLTGPKGAGTVYVDATRESGADWVYHRMDLRLKDGREIVLIKPAPETEGEDEETAAGCEDPRLDDETATAASGS
ncbi:cytochrome c oxidase assembly factor Coa1 family protein [Lysobacter silvisoli]|nr:cytochrome c oxidase assembly factor Coa1 family protein [Lysobacter silvisoli]